MNTGFDLGSGQDKTVYVLVKPSDGKVWLDDGTYIEWDTYAKAIKDYLRKTDRPFEIEFIENVQ